MTTDDSQDIGYEEQTGYYVEEYHESPRGSFAVLSGRFRRAMHRTHMQIGAIVMRSAELLHLRRERDEPDDNASYGFDVPDLPPGTWERLKHRAQSRCDAVVARSAEVLSFRREHDDHPDTTSYGFEVPGPPPSRWDRLKQRTHARWAAVHSLSEEWLIRHDNSDDGSETVIVGANDRPPRASVGVWLAAVALLAARQCSAQVAAYGGFAKDWLRSRHIDALLWGLPALLAAAAFFELVWSGYREQQTAAPLILEYKIAAEQSLEAGKLNEANLLLHKVLTLDPSNIDGIYGLALVTAKQGSRDAARRLMQRIAPRGREGDARARYWLATDMMPQLQRLSDDERHALEEHLLRLQNEPPFDRDAGVLLGQFYLSQQRPADAAKHIEAACRWHPELFLLLAQLRAELGGPAPADGDLARARDVFRRQTQSDPGNVEACLKWAETEKLLRAYSNTEQILVAGLQRTANHTLLEALIAFYMTRFDAARNSREALNVEALECLERALRFDPRSARALGRLAELATARGGDSDVVRAAALRAIAVGKAPATAHLLLGLSANTGVDSSTATFHLDGARQLNPQTPLILNDLAWYLATIRPPQLDHALQVADLAVAAAPRSETALQLRGQILFRMGRFSEAVHDLNLNAPTHQRPKPARVAVAEVRESLASGTRTAAQQEALTPEARKSPAR